MAATEEVPVKPVGQVKSGIVKTCLSGNKACLSSVV